MRDRLTVCGRQGAIEFERVSAGQLRLSPLLLLTHFDLAAVLIKINIIV
jgi:hypothetical protein